jgi:hypothetical protein
MLLETALPNSNRIPDGTFSEIPLSEMDEPTMWEQGASSVSIGTVQ